LRTKGDCQNSRQITATLTTEEEQRIRDSHDFFRSVVGY
jgi:hypothetical protein